MENKQKWHPGELLSTSGNYWQTCTLHAGVKLDLFTAVGSGQRSAADVAGRLKTDPRATAMLLDALSAMGLLEKTAETYANTPESLKFLCRDSADYIGYIILHHHNLVESWAHLDEAVPTFRIRISGKISSWACSIWPWARHPDWFPWWI